MKTVRLTIPVLAIIILGLFFTGCASKKGLVGKNGYAIQYQLNEGDKFTMSSSSLVSTEIDQMGQVITSEIIGKSVDNCVVLSADKNTGNTIEMEIVERVQDLESAQGSNSTDFSGLAGNKVIFDVLKTGKVENIKGLEKLPAITTLDGSTLTEETYKMAVEGFFIKLPENNTKIGESWIDDQTQEVPIGGGILKVTGKTSYTLLEEVEKNGFKCLKIGIEGVSNVSGNLEQNGMALTLDRETTITGNMYFAIEKGMYIAVETESKAKGIIGVEAMGMEIPQNMLTKATMTVVFN